METLSRFSLENLPKHFMWQMIDFVRMQWADDITDDIITQLHPDRWHPTYFVLARNQMLISSAAVVWRTVSFEGISYKVYGLSAVLTYPLHRKQGYGARVVSVATDFIHKDSSADLAILQTAPYLKNFYGQSGWVHNPKIKILSGSPNNPVDDDGWIMSIFMSQKAQESLPKFENKPFYLDEYIW